MRATTAALALLGATLAAPEPSFAQSAQPGITSTAPSRDGTPGNPPGTAAGRAVGTTGGPDGTRANPPSTATGRAVDRAQGQTPRADGTPGNPPGTAAGRAVDRTLGTNSTGANPQGQGTASGSRTPAR